MTDETLHDLMLRVGLVRQRPNPWGQSLQPAWQRAPQANVPYRAPVQALADRNTLPYQRQETLPQRQVRNDMAQLADRSAAGGSTGYAERNQVREFGNSLMEATGAPSWARGIEDIQYGQPGRAIPEFLNGALATSSLATLPYGAGASAPIRGFQRPPMRAGLSGMATEAPRLRSAPPYRPLDERGNVVATDAYPFGFRGDEYGAGMVDPSQFYPVASDSNVTGAMARESAEEIVPTSSLVGTQRTISQDFLSNARPSTTEAPISVLRGPDGKLYVFDGHHRLASAVANGEQSVRANVHQRAPSASSVNAPRPPLRAALPELAAEAPRLPNAPARLPGRATDGSVLPIRPPQPIRQSMVGGSNDLAEAAAMRPQQAPDAGSGGAGQEGFNFDEPLYHGTSGAIEGEFIPSRGLELGNGVYVTPDAEFASQHATKHNQGGAVVPLYARQGRYATGEQYRNALDNVGNGRNHDATQAYLESRGYIGVRDGREIVVFRPENLTFRTQSPDGGSAQTGRSLADRVLNVEPAPTLRQAIAERVNPSPQSVIEPPAPTRIQPDAGGVQEGFGTTPFYRGAVHDVDTSQGPNQLAFFTPSREFAGEFPRALPAEQRRVGEYRLREDQLADFRNPETQQRVLAELADDADATDHLRRRIAQMRDKATGHIDWVISADPAIRDAIERAGYSGMWLDEGGGQASVAVFRNSDIRPASAQPDGGASGAGNFAWTDDNFTLAGDGGQIRGRLWTNGETGEQALKIDSSATLRPGTGQGVPLYIQAFQEAQRRGLPLVSDQRVSLSASHVYDALARRGYRVERNPTAEQVRGHWVSRDGDPVFRVTDAPNAGPPRTPPRTPPRPRPPRRQQ